MQSIRLLYSQKGKLQVGNILKRSFVSKRIMQNLHLVETASSEQPYARPKKQILHEPASGNATHLFVKVRFSCLWEASACC